MTKRYGLPYKGSKNAIASRIVDILPAGGTFVDLFCGGCAVTNAAMESGKWSRFLINDIDPLMPCFFLDAIDGKFADEKRWISREDFFPVFQIAKTCSLGYGNNLKTVEKLFLHRRFSPELNAFAGLPLFDFAQNSNFYPVYPQPPQKELSHAASL